MTTFLISFEVRPPSIPGVQETVIRNSIKTFDSWARPLRNVWLIKTYLTREQVIQYLRGSLGPNDKILIMRVSNDWISINLSQEVINWMKSGLE